MAGANFSTTLAKTTPSGIVSGDPFLVSYNADIQGQYLAGNSWVVNSLFGRIYNETAGSIVNTSAKMKWRRLELAQCKAYAITALDFPSLVDNATSTLTISVPCTFDDFVYWGGALDTRAMFISASVSALNTVAITATSLTGTVDLASANYGAYVVKPEVFDFIASKMVAVSVAEIGRAHV